MIDSAKTPEELDRVERMLKVSPVQTSGRSQPDHHQVVPLPTSVCQRAGGFVLPLFTEDSNEGMHYKSESPGRCPLCPQH
jgi:hypothetical protein